MPGKVNPVVPDVVNQIAFEVIGNDLAVTMAAEAGQLQLNAFEPVIAHSLRGQLACNHPALTSTVLHRTRPHRSAHLDSSGWDERAQSRHAATGHTQTRRDRCGRGR